MQSNQVQPKQDQEPGFKQIFKSAADTFKTLVPYTFVGAPLMLGACHGATTLVATQDFNAAVQSFLSHAGNEFSNAFAYTTGGSLAFATYAHTKGMQGHEDLSKFLKSISLTK